MTGKRQKLIGESETMERYVEVDDSKWYHKRNGYYFIHPNLMQLIWPHVIYVSAIHILFVAACYLVVADPRLWPLWVYSKLIAFYVCISANILIQLSVCKHMSVSDYVPEYTGYGAIRDTKLN